MNVLMPQLGETVAEGTVAKWHKKVGDKIAVDELLFDVETDKVSMEVTAISAGVITQILVPAGQTVDVGTVLAVIEESAGAAAAPAAQPAAPAAAPPPAAAEAAPPSWYAAMPPSMNEAREQYQIKGAAESAPAKAAEMPAAVQRDSHQRLSPAVRRIAAEYRLDLATVSGSGRNGRITRRNVLELIHARQSAPAQAASAPAPRPAPAPAPATPAPAARAPAPGPVPASQLGTKIPFTRIRRLTAEHMVRSKSTSPHVLQAVEVDFFRVDQVRKLVRDAWKAKHGSSLTYLPFIGNAVCRALQDFPHLNSSVEGDSLVLHEHVNLAIAVDLGAEGLVAPVIKAAETLSVAQLADAITDIAQRSRTNRLKPNDFAGGTYTLSNSGTFGTLITAPIINQPQVAILSTDGVRKKPVVVETADGDTIAIRPVGVLAQSFDHRAVDGAYSAAFLDRLRRLIEASNWSVEI
jgi:pyruvate dehydrogenase E2 component (dihydrolipoamide acetyltransferase)